MTTKQEINNLLKFYKQRNGDVMAQSTNNIKNKIGSTRKYKYVSEFIGAEWREWKENDLIFIDSQMGSGKSTFNIDVLSGNSRFGSNQILILVNRTRLDEQYQERIEDRPNVTLMTYQELESKIAHGQENKISNFKYIVADEAHYFMTDAWNKTTNLSFAWVMEQNAIKVFETATSTEINPFLYEFTKGMTGLNVYYYCLQDDYSYMNVYPYTQNSIKIIDFLMATRNKDKGEKIVFFTCRKDIGIEILEKYPDDTSIIYSNSSKEGRKYNTKDAIKEGKCINIITVATKCLDNGVSIEDESVKYIVADLYEPIPLIQCLGRKRVNYRDKDGNQVQEDGIKLYIKDWTGHLKKPINDLENRLKFINEKEQEIENGQLKVCTKPINGIQDILTGYDSITNKPIYIKKVNPLYRENLIQAIELYKSLDGQTITTYEIDNGTEIEITEEHMTWLEYIVKMLNGCKLFENDYKETLDDIRCKRALEEFMTKGDYNKKYGYEFNQEEYDKLIDRLNVVDNRGRLIKQIGKINSKLDINSIPYRIESRKKDFIDCETNKRVRQTVYRVEHHEPVTDKYDIDDCDFVEDGLR